MSALEGTRQTPELQAETSDLPAETLGSGISQPREIEKLKIKLRKVGSRAKEIEPVDNGT